MTTYWYNRSMYKENTPQKVVRHAITETIKNTPVADVKRAIDLLISKDGVFRTDERWVHDALRPLADEGVVTQDGSTISIGSNFETYLLNSCENYPEFSESLIGYRSLVQQKIEEYDVVDSDVMNKLQSIASTDEKLVYLTSVISETFGKLSKAIETTQALEAKLAEMDMSLSVMESITFDEDSNK